MERSHRYQAHLRWTGNRGLGTRAYGSYGRDHVVRADGKADLLGSSDAVFRGDASRWNPEELLVASLSACHMLWYLHLCARAQICVVEYSDSAEGTMRESSDGSGRFEEVRLRPRVVISEGDSRHARALHDGAHRMCFIANSVNFPVRHDATVVTARSLPGTGP